jgi:glycosyltransferase involved in cell wall biosynthesis
VVAALHRCFTGAPIHTTMCWRPGFADLEPIETTWLQPLARGPRSHFQAFPLMPTAWRTSSLTPADLYVTSFHTFSLHARVPWDAPHVVYCHTPPRFIWSRSQLGGERPLLRPVLELGARALGPGDRRRSTRPTRFLANSVAIADKVREVYDREAVVVHPPVDVDRFSTALGAPVGEHHLFFSRLVPYKRADVAIAAFNELGWPLVVAGDGRARTSLEQGAGPNIRFVGRVEDAELPALLAGARGLVFPGEEDFGIAMVEALATGTPVIAYGRGGAKDIVVDGDNGVLFDEQTPAALAAAVRRADAISWDRRRVSASADRFSEARFASQLRAVAGDVLGAA